MHLQHGHSFLPFYVAHCVRKFCLLLEPKDKRGVPSETLLISAELAQLCALGEELPDMACGQRRDSHSSEDTPPPSSLGKESNWSSLRSMQVLTTAPPPLFPTGDESNWFSLASAIRVYRHFLELDTDHDGMLTPDELASYGDGLLSLTPAFVSSGL